MNTVNDNAAPKKFRFRGMMQPVSMNRAEWLESLLGMLASERRYGAAHGRQYRLAMSVLGRSFLPAGM